MSKLSKLILSGAIVFGALLASPLMAQEHPLIGLQYPPFPQEVDNSGGWTLSDSYSINQIALNGQELLLLSRLLGRDSQGKAFFEVVNVLSLPPINTEIEYLMGGPLCNVDGRRQLNYMGIIKIDDEADYLTEVNRAWRVEGENFVEINPQNFSFQCDNYTEGI